MELQSCFGVENGRKATIGSSYPATHPFLFWTLGTQKLRFLCISSCQKFNSNSRQGAWYSMIYIASHAWFYLKAAISDPTFCPLFAFANPIILHVIGDINRFNLLKLEAGRKSWGLTIGEILYLHKSRLNLESFWVWAMLISMSFQFM